MARRQLVELAPLRPVERRSENCHQVEPRQILAAAQAVQMPRQPAVERIEQGLIGEIGPRAFGAINRAQQADARLKLLRFGSPGQGGQAQLTHAVGQRRRDTFGRRVAYRGFAEHERAQPALPVCGHRFATAIPGDGFHGFDQVCELLLDLVERDRRSEEDAAIDAANKTLFLEERDP